MNAAARIGGFVAALAAVFVLALVVGHQVGPVGEPAQAHAGDGHGTAPSAAAAEVPGGLMVAQDGYALALEQTTLPAGAGRSLAFVIEGPDGSPVTSYDEEHEKDLHLIVVRRDFGGFQHVHPTLDSRGTWRVPVDLTPGAWRVFADFKATGGKALTLGADLIVPGDAPAPADQPLTRTATVDGYTVTLTGDLVAGEDASVRLRVSRDGRPVTDLDPYLGAYGHLVALRDGDLAYLHVHPEGMPGDGTTAAGPDVDFVAEVPSPGRYHLYLDFSHGGVVRTAAFTVTAAPGDTTPDHQAGSDDHGH